MPLYTNENTDGLGFYRVRFSFSLYSCSDFSLFFLSTLIIGRKSTGFGRIKGLLCPSVFCYTSHCSNLVPLSLILNPCLSRGEYKRKRHFRQGWMHCLRQPLTERLNFTSIFLTLPFPFLLSPSKDECLQGGKGFCWTGKWRQLWSTPFTLPTIRRRIHRRSDPRLQRICTK